MVWTKETLGAMLREARERKGLDREELAELAWCSDQHLYTIERGAADPDLWLVMDIIRAYGKEICKDGVEIGRRLAEARELRSMSKKDVAAAAGIVPSTLTIYESGDTPPGTVCFLKICDALSVDPMHILRVKKDDAAAEC